MLIECKEPREVVKEAFWLAYQAAGSEGGMGVLQARDNVTKEQVWDNVSSKGDYPASTSDRERTAKEAADEAKGRAYGDYIFGRMVKLSLEWGDGKVECFDREPRGDYQAWCGKYPTYEALVRAAVANLQSPVEA